MSYRREYSIKKKLEKNEQHKKLTGVCAGIAKYYDVPRLAVRIGAVLALITLPAATGVAYVVATVVLPTSEY